MGSEESICQAGSGPKGASGSTFRVALAVTLRRPDESHGCAPFETQCCEAETRRRVVGPNGRDLPRPLHPGGHDDLPEAARRIGGPLVDAGGRSHRGVGAPPTVVLRVSHGPRPCACRWETAHSWRSEHAARCSERGGQGRDDASGLTEAVLEVAPWTRPCTD